MSEIIKTEAVVLKKLNYGDTSSILSLYTFEFGKISAIIKGGRNPKSKMGMIADPPNHIEVILYKKDTREVQFLSGAEIIAHFPQLKENLDSLKFAYAVVELVQKLTPDDEPNKRIFNGLIRIISLLNSSDEKPEIIFGRFMLFFIDELGYGIDLDKCSICESTELNNKELGYNLERGLLCENCKREHVDNFKINMELFNYLICLKTNKRIEIRESTIRNANDFFELYLNYHIPDFKGLQSLKSY
jgi:DNA repair protein RecO (recombination protein O)